MSIQWERRYLEELIDQLKPTGDVLQVGFSNGIAAERIQTYHPKHHTIIESDPQIAEKAKKWAKGNPAITILSDRWERAIVKLGHFDAVFYDDFKPQEEIDKAKVLASAGEAVKKGKELVADIHAKFPEIKKMQYSDSDLELLFEQFGKSKPSEVARFLEKLYLGEQISQAQFEMGVLFVKDLIHGTPEAHKLPSPPTPMFAFLKMCLQKHMRKGARFTCFAKTPLSKFEDPVFLEEIIANPNYDYEEKTIPVDVPASCEYYKFKEALVMLVVKQVESLQS